MTKYFDNIALAADLYRDGLDEIGKQVKALKAKPELVNDKTWIINTAVAIGTIRAASKRIRIIQGAPSDIMRTALSMADQYDAAVVAITKAIDNRNPRLAERATVKVAKGAELAKKLAAMLQKVARQENDDKDIQSS